MDLFGVHGIRSPTGTALVGMTALAIAMGIGRFAFTPILPMMQIDLGLSIPDAGWLASVNYLGNLAGALAATTMRAPTPLAIRGGLLTIGIATLLMGPARGFSAWLLLRTIAGIATVWVLVFASAWSLERLTPFRRPVLQSMVFAGFGVGIAAAGGVCLVLMSAEASSRMAWMTLGAITLVLTALLWPTFGVTRTGQDRGPTDRFRWDADFARLVLCYGIFGFGYIIPATFLPAMARQIIPDPLMFGWSWPFFGAAAAGSTFLVAGFAERLGNRRLWSVGHMVMAVGVALPALWPGFIAIILSALLVGSTFTVVTMAGFQEAGRRAGAHARQAIGAFAAAFSLGQIAGPLVVSYVARAGGSFSEGLLVAAVLLTASAWALRQGRR